MSEISPVSHEMTLYAIPPLFNPDGDLAWKVTTPTIIYNRESHQTRPGKAASYHLDMEKHGFSNPSSARAVVALTELGMITIPGFMERLMIYPNQSASSLINCSDFGKTPSEFLLSTTPGLTQSQLSEMFKLGDLFTGRSLNAVLGGFNFQAFLDEMSAQPKGREVIDKFVAFRRRAHQIIIRRAAGMMRIWEHQQEKEEDKLVEFPSIENTYDTNDRAFRGGILKDLRAFLEAYFAVFPERPMVFKNPERDKLVIFKAPTYFPKRCLTQIWKAYAKDVNIGVDTFRSFKEFENLDLTDNRILQTIKLKDSPNRKQAVELTTDKYLRAEPDLTKNGRTIEGQYGTLRALRTCPVFNSGYAPESWFPEEK